MSLEPLVSPAPRVSHGGSENCESQGAAPLAANGRRVPELFDDYVPTRMSMTDIQRLVREDAKEPDPIKRAIFRVWPNFPVHPQIDISARTIKADAARRSFNARGGGITWAVVDSGIDASHPHFTGGNTLGAPDVKDLHRDFTHTLRPGEDTKDAALHDGYGHGTRVASIIAGYLPADFPIDDVDVISEQITETDDPNPIPTKRMVNPASLSGMAPDTHLVSLKVLADDGTSTMMAVMAALRYVRELNGDNDKVTRIHGVNVSLGYEFDPQWFACGQSPLCKEVDRLVRSGVVVVVAAGNTGYARFSSWERVHQRRIDHEHQRPRQRRPCDHRRVDAPRITAHLWGVVLFVEGPDRRRPAQARPGRAR